MINKNYTELAKAWYEELFVPYLSVSRLDAIRESYIALVGEKEESSISPVKFREKRDRLYLRFSNFLVEAYSYARAREIGVRADLSETVDLDEVDSFIRQGLESLKGKDKVPVQDYFFNGSMVSPESVEIIVPRFFSPRRYSRFRQSIALVFGLKETVEIDRLYGHMLTECLSSERVPAAYYFEKYLLRQGEEHLTEEESALRWIRALLSLTEADPSWAWLGKPKFRMNDLVTALNCKKSSPSDEEILSAYNRAALGALAYPAFVRKTFDDAFNEIDKYRRPEKPDPALDKLRAAVYGLISKGLTLSSLREIVTLADRCAAENLSTGESVYIREAARTLLGSRMFKTREFLRICTADLIAAHSGSPVRSLVENAVAYYLDTTPAQVFREPYGPYADLLTELAKSLERAGKSPKTALEKREKYLSEKKKHSSAKKESKKFVDENFVQLRRFSDVCAEVYPEDPLAAGLRDLMDRCHEESTGVPYLRIIALILGGFEDLLLRSSDNARAALREFLYDTCFAFNKNKAPGDSNTKIADELFSKALELPTVNFRSAEDVVSYACLERGLPVEKAKSIIISLRGEAGFKGDFKDEFTVVIRGELMSYDEYDDIEKLPEILMSKLVKPGTKQREERQRTFLSLFSYLSNYSAVRILESSEYKLCNQAAAALVKAGQDSRDLCEELCDDLRRALFESHMSLEGFPDLAAAPQYLEGPVQSDSDLMEKAVAAVTDRRDVAGLEVMAAAIVLFGAEVSSLEQVKRPEPELDDDGVRVFITDVINGEIEKLLYPEIGGVEQQVTEREIGESAINTEAPLRGDLMKAYLIYSLKSGSIEHEKFVKGLNGILVSCSLPLLSPRYATDRYIVSLARYYSSK